MIPLVNRGLLFGLLTLLHLAPDPVLGQTARIAGTILERGSGEPVPAAHVVIQGTMIGTSTGMDGTFLIEGLRPGVYTVTASALGFSSDTREVIISDREQVELDIELAAVHLRLPNVEVVGQASAIRRSVGAVTVLSTADMNLARPLGTEEVLRKVPGVHISTDDGISNRANIGIRGTYPRRSEKILLLEDGVPIQPAMFVAPSAYYNPPTERIDAIEVIKNASNIRFGVNTIGGVINYITRRPPIEPSGTLRLTGGEFGYFSAFAAYGGTRMDQTMGGEIQALFTRGDGQRENTSFDIYNVTGKGLYRLSRATTVSLKGNYHREDAFATYSALTPYMFEVDPHQNPFKDDFLATERMAGDLNVHSVIGSGTAITATAYANRFQRYWWRQASHVVDARSVDPAAPQGSLIRVGKEENRARLRDFYVAGVQPRLVLSRRTGSVENDLEIGVRLHSETFYDVEIDTDRPYARPSDFEAASYSDLSDPNGRKRKNDQLDARSVAAYVQNRFELGPISATPGVRIERYTIQRIHRYDRASQTDIHDEVESTDVEMLPALGFNVDLGDATLFGGVHSAFVPLSGSTAFMDLVDDAGVQVNEKLESERSTNLEVGIRAQPLAILGMEVALFQNTVRNLIAAGRNASFQPILDNLGRVRYRGVEAAAGVDVGRLMGYSGALRVDGTMTLMQSEILRGLMDEEGTSEVVAIRGNEAPYAPSFLYTIGVTASPLARVEVRATYSFVGEQFADFNNTILETPVGDNGLLPSYAFLDATLRYDLPQTGIRAFVAAKNLTNEIYRGSRMHRSSSGIFPGGFRQVNLGVEWNF